MESNKLSQYDTGNTYQVILLNRIDIVKAANELAVWRRYDGQLVLGVKRI